MGVALVSVAGITACGSSDSGGESSKTTTAAAAKTTKPIVIAAPINLTGWMADSDVPVLTGMKMAISDYNAKGGILGRKIELKVEDQKSDVGQGAKLALSLAPGADVMITPSDFDMGAPAALVAQSKGLLNISPSAASAKFGDLKSIGDLAFSDGSTVNGAAAAIAEWAHDEKGYRSAYMLQDNSIVYTTGLCHGFEDRWKAYTDSKLVGVDTFKNADTSFSSQVQKLKAIKPAPEVIYMCSYPPGGPSVIRQLRAAGIETPILLPDSFDTTGWTKAVPHASNLYFATYASIHGDDPDESVNANVKKYEEVVGKPPTRSHFLVGYATIQLYAAAVEAAGTTDSQKVKSAMEQFKDQKSVIQPTTFTPTSHIANRAATIIQMQDGKASFAARKAATKVPAYRP